MSAPSNSGTSFIFPTLSVSKDAPGTITLRLGGEQITLSISDRPRSALALDALASAIEIEGRVARDGVPDLAKWSGKFHIPMESDNG